MFDRIKRARRRRAQERAASVHAAAAVFYARMGRHDDAARHRELYRRQAEGANEGAT